MFIKCLSRSASPRSICMFDQAQILHRTPDLTTLCMCEASVVESVYKAAE